MWELRKLGRKESTLVAFSRKLGYLEKHVNLNQPENVKEFIANLQCSDGHKDNLIDVYYHYAKFNGLRWSKPHYFIEERVTRVPRGGRHQQDYLAFQAEVCGCLQRNQRHRHQTSRARNASAQIRLYDLRHFAGSMCHYKTKDIIFTLRFLGHCDIKNTLRYVHLINSDKEEHVCKCAKEVSETSQLIESGFEYVTEVDSKKLFRKPK